MVNKDFQVETKQDQGKYCLSEQDEEKVQSAGKKEFLEKDAYSK